MNDDIKLADFVQAGMGMQVASGRDPNKLDILAAKDCNGFNAGVLMLRTGAWSVDFLKNVTMLHDQSENITRFDIYQEQACMAHLFADKFVDEHVQFVPQFWFNSYGIGYCGMQHQPDDFLVHFPGDKRNIDAFLEKRLK